MADSIWPTSLPQELELAGNSSTRRTPVIRSDNGFGSISTRRTGSVVMEEVTRPLHLTKAQYLTFENFVDDHADRGGTWVRMPLTDALGTAEQRVRILDYDAVKQADDLWLITLTLEWVPRRLTKRELDNIITGRLREFSNEWSTEFDRVA